MVTPKRITPVQEWTERLIIADTLREPWRRAVKDSRRQYINAHPGTGQTAIGEDKPLKYNLFQASMRNIRAMLKPRVLEAKLFAKDETAEASQPVTQALVNHQAREARLAHETGKFLQHVLLDGHAFFRVGWGIPLTPQVDVAGREDADDPTWQRNGREGKRPGNPEDILKALRKVYPRFMVGKDQPIAVVEDPMDVLVDPDVTDLLDASWYAVRTWMTRSSIEELIKVKHYRPVELRGINGKMMPSSKDRWGEGQFSTNQQEKNRIRRRLRGENHVALSGIDQDKIEVWEIHDVTNSRIMQLIPGMPEFLFDEEAELTTERPLLVDFKTDYLPTSYWVPPDNQQYIDIQKDLDAVVNYIRDFLRRHGKTLILARRGVSEDDVEAVTDAQTADVVEVTDPKDFNAVNLGNLSGDFLNYLQILQNGMTISSGVSPVAQGVPTSTGASATEIATIARSLSIRMDDIRIELDRSVEDVLNLFIDLNQQFLPQDVVISLFGVAGRAFGEESQLLKIKGGPSAVRGKFGIELVVGAAGETKQNVERQQTLAWWNMMAAAPHSKTREMEEEVHRAFGKNPQRFMTQEGEKDFSMQEAEAMAQGGGAVVGEGRSAGEAGGVKTISPGRAGGRTGIPSDAAIASQAQRQ